MNTPTLAVVVPLQDIYNRVRDHLLKQDRRAVDYEGGCRYRAENGDRCAAGCLITDEAYTSKIEQGILRTEDENISGDDDDAVRDRLVLEVLAKSLRQTDLTVSQRDLIREMQSLHDHTPVSAWAHELRAVADAFQLIP